MTKAASLLGLKYASDVMLQSAPMMERGAAAKAGSQLPLSLLPVIDEPETLKGKDRSRQTWGHQVKTDTAL
ncbi:hypothetical protein NDU88_000710 [Pleurodeles waltl]|uniref:Uncharacterized protein n=1 Tax=Pleurodeles waltl TaxID=8319 RepID=A0AAV7Q116_PLEWA|nr:hypothetical protein NDU88_000710 [Pleurodeles waltl]